jgi:glucose/mannose-6-phosphate isomerase
MKDLIAGFPGQLKEAVRLFREQPLPALPAEVSQVLVSGLGGSGIGGTILSEYAGSKASVPVMVSKDYFIPAWVGSETLLIISSYSGNTEETLEAFRNGLKAGAMIICVSTGGELAKLADANGVPLIRIPGGKPPRACLGYSFTQLCGLLDYYGILPGVLLEIEMAIMLLESEQAAIMTEAESLARGIAYSLPVIYTSPGYEGVAVRFRQQLNENAKMLCWHHVVPEMNHNELVGWAEKQPKIAALFMRNSDEYYRTARRMEICKEIISALAGKTIEIHSKGDTEMERLIYWIHLGDWISWFAAVERNQDAMEIDVINRLKGELSALP